MCLGHNAQTDYLTGKSEFVDDKLELFNVTAATTEHSTLRRTNTEMASVKDRHTSTVTASTASTTNSSSSSNGLTPNESGDILTDDSRLGHSAKDSVDINRGSRRCRWRERRGGLSATFTDLSNCTTTRLWLTMSIFTTLIAFSACFVGFDGKHVKTPPRLEKQPKSEFWFHSPSTGRPSKFTLECQAVGDTEKYVWYKNDERLNVDGERIVWERPGQSGTIAFLQPTSEDQAYYQCHVSNIFGTAVSNRVHVQMGVLGMFPKHALKEVTVNEGDPLTLECERPAGVPEPKLFWVYRDKHQSHVFETISREHITVDGEGNLRFSYVKAHDARKNLIYQCAATSPVLQGEYKTGDEFKIVAVKRRRILPRRAELMWSSPANVRVKAGSRLKLTCIFSGYPLPKVQWSKESKKGAELPVDRLRMADFDKSLIIEPVRPSDEGTYTCRNMGAVHRVNVTVTAAPYWSSRGPPVDISMPEQSTAELRCDADGDPRPIVLWYMNGQPLDAIKPNSRRMIVENGRALRISRMHHDVDTAVYQCNASNPFGYVFANAFVNVKAHEPKFSSAQNQTFNLVSGTTVDLHCVVDAAPLPVVRWVDKRDQLLVSRANVQIFPNNTLRMTDVSFDDENIYYCNVSNKYGIDRARYNVRVFDPTFFTNVSGSHPRLLEAHDSMELFCEAKSDSRLQIRYHWLKNEKPLDTSDRHYRLPRPNRLQLHRIRGRHSGEYKCVAETLVDVKTSATRIVVKDVPAAPRLTSVECDQRMAAIKWDAADPNAVAVSSYTVELNTGFQYSRWTPIIYEHKIENRSRFEGHISLSPWVNYTFRVFAENARGRGPPGYQHPTSVCHTRPTFPYKNPANVSAQGETPDTLKITWQPLEKEDWNADLLVYQISYRLDQPGEEWQTFEITDSQRDHEIIRDQPTFRQYLVKVRAKNAIGVSIIEPAAVVGYSGESEPTEAPGSFDSEIINATAVLLSWGHVNVDNVMGHFQGYRVQAWETPSRAKRSVESSDGTNSTGAKVKLLVDQLVPKEAKSVLLNAFEPMRSYVAQVLAENMKYRGPPSSQLYIRMPQGLPSEVTALRVRSVGARTILVEWQPPEVLNGILQGYFLEFTEFNSSDAPYKTYVLVPTQFYVRAPVKPRTAYSVGIWAETGGGIGPALYANVTTFPSAAPGKPSLMLNKKGTTTLTIDWIPPEEGMPGAGFYLNYSVKDSGVWRRSKGLVETPTERYELTGLLPSTEYRVHVVSVDDGRTTPSEAALFRTDDLKPTMRTVSSEAITGIAWFIAGICSVTIALVSMLIVCVCQRSKSGKYPVKQKEMERGFDTNKEEERTFMEYQYGTNYGKDEET